MLEEYIKNICYYVIISTILFNIFPDEKYVKYIKLFSGFILIMIVLPPIAKIFNKDFEFKDIVYEFSIETEQGKLEKEICEYESIIGERIKESETVYKYDENIDKENLENKE